MGKTFGLILCLAASTTFAQSSAQIEQNKGVLKVSPTTALPNPCRQGQLWFDSTTTTPKSCNDGTTWSGLGASSGSPVSGCTINSLVYIDASGNLKCDAAPATIVSGVFKVTNGAAAANIAVFSDNVTPVFTIADGGAVTSTGSNTWSGGQAFNAGMTLGANQLFNISTYGSIRAGLLQTPDTVALETGTASNSYNMYEAADGAAGYDFNNGRCATSACTDPSLIVHSHNQATTEYAQLSNDGTLAHLDAQAGTNGVGQFAWAGNKTLTESSATVVVDIPVASGAYTGATINWTVVASDATDHQSRRGATYLAVVNKAGTETCTVGDIGTPVVAVSVGTLTVTTAADTTGANVCTLTINAVSSLTQTVLRAYYSVQVDGPGIPLAR